MRSFSVAGVCVRLDFEESVISLPDSFSPFECGGDGDADMVFRFGSFEMPEGECIESFSNDAGTVRLFFGGNCYYFSISFLASPHLHYMKCSGDFSRCLVKPDCDDKYLPQVVSSLVRIAFAQRLSLLDGFSIHASCVVLEGRAYLFLGPSGTGKSTHSRLWLSTFPGAFLLNDDNPVCRYGEDGILRAFGSPWSGKTPCYRNDSAPVGAFVTLEQSKKNEFTLLKGIPAWISIFSSCSLISQDDCLYLHFEKTLNRLVGEIVTAHLSCLPDKAAAVLCRESLKPNYLK